MIDFYLLSCIRKAKASGMKATETAYQLREYAGKFPGGTQEAERLCARFVDELRQACLDSAWAMTYLGRFDCAMDSILRASRQACEAQAIEFIRQGVLLGIQEKAIRDKIMSEPSTNVVHLFPEKLN